MVEPLLRIMNVAMPNAKTELDRVTPVARQDLPPAGVYDPVIEAYKKNIDRTLLRENLKLSVEERLQKFVAFMNDLDEVRQAGRRMRETKRSGD